LSFREIKKSDSEEPRLRLQLSDGHIKCVGLTKKEIIEPISNYFTKGCVVSLLLKKTKVIVAEDKQFI